MLDIKIIKQIEFYLYNYQNIDELIQEIEEDIISAGHISANAWLKGLGKNSANTVENQAIRLAENKTINNLKKWKIFLRKVLKYLHDKKPKIYAFVKLKYFSKCTKDQIETQLKLNKNVQRDITNKVVSFIYRNSKIQGLEVKK